MRDWLIDVTARGLNIERLIRRAGEEVIALLYLEREARCFRAQVKERDLGALRELCAKGGWKLETGSRHGAGRALAVLRRRRVLLAACLAGVAALWVSAMLMWRVEIDGAGSYYADIRRYLTERGYAALQWKSAVDPAQIRDELEWRYPDIAWIEVGWRGPVLRVSVHKGQAMGDTLTCEGSCDVVASRAGIVESIVTVAGTPAVTPGTMVQKGDVLIRGEERGGNGTVHPVAARGQVMARVWDGASVCVSLTETETVYTGRTRNVQLVRTPWFPLWPEEGSGYEQQDVSVRAMPLGGLFIPLWMEERQYREANIRVKARDMEEAKAEAAMAAMRKLREKVGTEDKLIDKWVEYSMIEDVKLQAVAVGERCVDIAARQNLP